MDVFRKLLLIRSWSPDRTLSQAKKYVIESLGRDYGEAKILDLEATWAESEPRTPLICILSIGSDPSPLITALAKSKSTRKFIKYNFINVTVCTTINELLIFNVSALRSVSMGQGQEFVARKMINDAMAGGGWVLLQNIHLSLPFCTEAMDALVESDQIYESFRLWMTTEVHPQFPIGLLQVIM